MEVLRKKIKIMIVDDHEILRKGLIRLLIEEQDFDVICEAENGEQTLFFLRDYCPHVILLDIDMPVMNGKETLIYITKQYPHIKVIMLTMYKGAYLEHDYMDLGAHSFLPKETDFEKLCKVIRTVSKGRYYYNNKSSMLYIPDKCNEHLIVTLNEREKDIITLMCDNKTNAAISKQLEMNINTIRYYRRTIFNKTKSKSITDLVKYAMRNGIIFPE